MSFAIAIWEVGAEGSKSIHALDENMDVIWTQGSLSTGTNYFYSIVVDLANNVLYNTIKGSTVNLCKIQKRSLTDGAVQATSADLDKGTCLCCVDADGRVWTCRPYRDLATDIIVYNTDLTVYESVDVPGENHNAVYYAAVTRDGLYVYLVGNRFYGDGKNYVSKYSVSNLYSGEAAEWEVELTGSTGLLEHCCVDVDDNIYCAAYSYDGVYQVGLWKVNSSGVVQWSGNPINGDRAAVVHNSKIYTPKDANANFFGQYNASTGALIGSSADAGAEVWDMAVDSGGSYVYGSCTYSTSIKKYDTDDWSTEAPVDSFTGTYSCIWYFGDPTGYVNLYLGGGKVATPTADPDSSTIVPHTLVTLSCATEGATIYFTVDGTTPDDESIEYTNPIDIVYSTTIKAIAYKTGMTESDVATFNYVTAGIPIWIDPVPDTPIPIPDNDGYDLVGNDVRVDEKYLTEKVKFQDGSSLRISQQYFEIKKSGVSLGSLSISEESRLRMERRSCNCKVVIQEAGFKLKEIGSNLYISQKTDEEIVLQDLWR